MSKNKNKNVEKKQFTTPVIKIVELYLTDIIATSSGDGTPIVTNDDM